MKLRARYVALGVVVVAAAVAAFVLLRPSGLTSEPVDSVPPLLSEPAGVPGEGLVLAPDGLGPVAFGDDADEVLTTLRDLLGDPVEDSVEPCGSGGGDVRWVRWANLTVALQGGTFRGYISGIYFPPDSPEMKITTVDEVGLRASVAELTETYGDRFAWLAPVNSGFGNSIDAFGIDGFDVGQLGATGLGGYVEGGRADGQVITFIGGQPCVDNGA